MKKISILYSFFLLLFFVNGNSQTINAAGFLKDFNEIFEDAKNGFNNSRGDLTEQKEWYGNSYKSKKAIFASFELASLQYVKAHEPTKWVPEATPELFYFNQGLYLNDEQKNFAKDSLEIILDTYAKELGITKKEIKQKKEYRKKYREVEYQKNGKAVFGFFQVLENNHYSVKIFSPYRPDDVPKPKHRLGCILFKYSGFVYVYAVTVYGEKISDMSSTVKKAFSATGLIDSNYTYYWHPNKSVDQISIDLGKGVIVRDAGSIDAN